jgi:hypothetical protein
MKQMMSRAKLQAIDQEFQGFKKENPGLFLAINDRIKRFYDKAEHELKVTATRYNALQNAFIQKDPTGEYLTVKHADDTVDWLYISDGEALKNAGVIDVSMVKDEFEKACQKLLSQTISFDW